MNATILYDFRNLTDYPLLKIIHGILFVLGLFITIICYYGFIHFEHYGSDPMKRGIKNKLIAQIFIAILSLSCINNPVFAWRILIGPVHENIAILAIFFRQCTATYGILCLTEIILYKSVMFFGWKYFCFIGNGWYSFIELGFSNF